jgi:alkylhydroperoxidase family enzyme
VALSRGAVDEADLAELRDAGYTDEQIVEIVAHVALNTFTNYVNEVFGTPLDFPPVAPATRLA